MTATAIEWATDVWNPTTGCDRVSPGCDRCYALTMARRLKGMGSAKYQRDGDPATSGPGFGITEHATSLTAPLGWRKPRRIFVNSMSDLFHAGVSDEFIARVWAVMAATPQHTYQILTKRHGRMRSLLSSEAFDLAVAAKWEKLGARAGALDEDHTPPYPLRNVWLGVSVEDQKRADLRIPALLDTPSAVRFLSCEPLLGPVDLLGQPDHGCDEAGPAITHDGYTIRTDYGTGTEHDCDHQVGIDWVIVGGESGPGARPMHPGWARQLRDQCTAAGVPFFFKQHGQWGPVDNHRQWFHGARWIDTAGQFVEVDEPHDLDAHQAAGLQLMQSSREGKKATGRELDGRTWDEFPAVSA